MAYQLPQELQTAKTSSLTGDAKKLADEVIANKFGIGEVVEKSKISPKYTDFGQTTLDKHQVLSIALGFKYGSRYFNFAISAYQSFEYMNKSEYIESVVRKIEQEVRNIEFENGPVSSMRASLGRDERNIRSLNDLADFIYEHFQDTRGVS